MIRGVRIGVFMRDLEPSRGRCPACGAVQDDSGCRVIRQAIISAAAGTDTVAPEHRELRDLLLDHPFVADVECRDPEVLAKQRAWDAADRLDHPGVAPQPEART